jgi:8-oxo-dGTP pyrophosphatase MutT (NUDIX family)
MEAQRVPPTRTVAAAIAGADGRVLLVRKRGSAVFIQPGGKTEPGEAPLPALARELEEELGVDLDVAGAVRLGEFEAAAVNEPGRTVRAQAYACAVRGVPAPRAEIEELAWVDPAGPFPVQVAPLSAAHILPAFLAFAGRAKAPP